MLGRQWRQASKRTKTHVSVVGALVLGVLALTLTPQSATAETGVGRDTVLRNWGTGVCLDSNNAGKAYVLGCNQGTYQTWYTGGAGRLWLNDLPLEVIIFRNLETDSCLDSNLTGAVYIQPCWPGDNWQRWIWWGDTYRGMYQNLESKLCLQTDGTALRTEKCADTHDVYAQDGKQLWRQGF